MSDRSATVDPLYVAARRVLLEALIALAPHRSSVIVAGAQAVYLRVQDADLSVTVAPYTTDGDLAINPIGLSDHPQLEAAMRTAGFDLQLREGGHVEPGIWIMTTEVDGENVKVPIDLIVPDAVAPPGGRRAARLGGAHGNLAARRAVGLEAALVDHDEMEIVALEPGDNRVVRALVAGPTALLVAKLHKIHDRVESGRRDRLNDKDAADVIRLMRGVSAGTVGGRLGQLLGDDRAAEVTAASLHYLDDLFGRAGRVGIRMASEALRLALAPEEVEALAVAFTRAVMDLVDAP